MTLIRIPVSPRRPFHSRSAPGITKRFGAQPPQLLDALVSVGYSPQVVRLIDDMNDYDLYDVIASAGYGLDSTTKEDRALAFRYKQNDWLGRLPENTRAAVVAIADQFKHGGTDDLENNHLFRTPEVAATGGVAALAAGGDPARSSAKKERIFAA